MSSPTSSHLLPALVGRIVVLIPTLDYGYIEQVKEGFTNKKGNPAIDLLEKMAVRRAKAICVEKNLVGFVILTDSQAAADPQDIPEVKWLEYEKLQFASLFLQRIINRARYIRRSGRKTINRPPVTTLQKEQFDLFNAERQEFELPKSPLWTKIQTEIANRVGVGQERLK